MIKATIEDIVEINLCNKRNLSEHYSLDEYTNLFNSNQVISYIIKESSKVIGYIIMYASIDNKNNKYGHILSLAVDTEYRRKGYASQLINIAEKYIISKFSIKYLTLYVRKSNKIAQKLYYKHKYFYYKKLKKYYKLEDALILKKMII